MQRKKGKIILLMIAAMMLIVTVFYVADRYVRNPFVKKNSAVGTKTDKNHPTEDGMNTEETEELSLPVSKTWNQVLPYEKNIEKIGQPFVVKSEYEDAPYLDTHMEICVNEARITKERVDTDALYYALDRYPIQVDEEKNILNNYNYVVVNITLRNLMETETEFYVNSFDYFSYNPQIEDLEDMGELQGYKTLADPFVYDKSYARVLIPGGGEFTCNLVYLQKDESIEGKIPYLFYSHTGMSVPYDDKARFVRLDEGKN